MMFDIDEYFSKDKAAAPYKDSNENLADYTALAWLITDMGIRWRDECNEEEGIPTRGIRISDNSKKSIDILRSTPFDDREEDLPVAEIKTLVREGLEYILSRESATKKQDAAEDGACPWTDILRIRNVIDSFKLTKRMSVLMLLLIAARGDIHILESFSYIACDNSILKAGFPTVGLLDMLLHLIFKYEVIQAEAIIRGGDAFTRYLVNVSGTEENTLKKRLSICDHVYRYIMFGEKDFYKKPEMSMPDTGVYYEGFAEKLSAYEDSFCGDTDSPSSFCYIRVKDTFDVVHVLTKVFEKKDKALYVIEPKEVEAGRKSLFFMLTLMHKLHDARLLIKIVSEEEEEKKGGRSDFSEKLANIIHIIRKELPSMNTVYLTATAAFPVLDVHGIDAPAVLSLDMPAVDMRIAMWGDLFKKYSLKPDKDIDLMDIADCHILSFGQIRTVAERCAANLRMAALKDSVVTRDLLQEILFSLSKIDFEHLVTQVDAKYTWDDIFLDESQKRYLKYACDRFRLRNRVGAQWEITKKNAYGNAVIVLMYGPPGTGKTMAAQVIANEVMTPLYRVDVSQIFSKYIGETQKNISRIFEEAQKRSVVLFFDEADALFTRRTEIRDSHDKYANSDTSFLLQKVEEYSGISILATNNAQSFDPAFMRRLTYVVRFERPDEETRKAMWHSMVSDKVPMAADVDLDWFAENFDELSGSNIKSVILTACFMAAADGEALGMKHLVKAMGLEYEKMGRLLEPGAFGRYAGYLMG